MLTGLALPVLILMSLAFCVTRLIERRVPETLPGLVAMLVVSTLLLWLLSSAGFAALYLWRGVAFEALFGTAGSLAHFLTLGAKSALVWAPIILLTVVTAPGRWKEEVW